MPPPVAVKLTLPQPVVEPVMPAVGGVLFAVTDTEAVAEQLASVTVTVYVPAVVALLVELVPPPLQA